MNCGAKSHQTGLPCKLVAGFGTPHKGEGRCKFHGGIVGKNVGRPVMHGGYATRSVIELANILGIRDPIEARQALIIITLNQHEKAGTLTGDILFGAIECESRCSGVILRRLKQRREEDIRAMGTTPEAFRKRIARSIHAALKKAKARAEASLL